MRGATKVTEQPSPRAAGAFLRRFPLPCSHAIPSTVRSCLLVLVLVCLLPATAAAGIALWWAYRDGRAALVDHAQLNARAMSRTVDSVLSNATAGLQALATSPELASGDLPAFAEQALRVLPYQVGNNVVLSDTSGQQRVNTLGLHGQLLPKHGNPSFQAQVIAKGEPAVSDLFIGGVLRKPLVVVEVPVRQGGRVSYTLAMGFLPERFAAILAQQRPAPEWIVSIFDSTGTILARTHEADLFVGKKGAPALLAAIERYPEGMVETQTLEGLPVFAVYTRSALTGWTVAVGVPRHVLLAQLQRWTAWLAVSAAALLLLGVMTAQAIAGRIAAAIEALIEPATALGEGRPVSAHPVPIEEASAVASALVRASQLLRTRTGELDAATRATMAMQIQAKRFEHAARHDPLTELANRAHFEATINEKLRACEHSGGHFTVLFVDIDDFKPVNDLYGHAVGDELLRAFATRLRAGVREGDAVARIGGDEFALLVDGHSPQELQPIALQLVDRLSRPYAIRNLTIEVSASIGAAGYPEDGRSVEALLEAADAAMYNAKAGGKRRFSTSDSTPP
jgi:diguanylate cyclase (GGDEF)-like protein